MTNMLINKDTVTLTYGNRCRNPQPSLGQALGVQLSRGRRRDYMSERRKPTETTDMILWELTDSEPTAREFAWEQWTPHPEARG